MSGFVGIEIISQKWFGKNILSELADERQKNLPGIGQEGVNIMRSKLGNHVETRATWGSIMWATKNMSSSVIPPADSNETIPKPTGISSVYVGSAHGAGRISKSGTRYSIITAIEYGATGPGQRIMKGLGFIRKSVSQLKRMGNARIQGYAKPVIDKNRV